MMSADDPRLTDREREGIREFERWEREATIPRSVTIQTVANWLHTQHWTMPDRGPHEPIHSCGCMHIARSLFRLNGIGHMFWPAENRAGGNAYAPWEPTRDELRRLALTDVVFSHVYKLGRADEREKQRHERALEDAT